MPLDLEEIAVLLECDVADVQRVQKLIQYSEPVGACSRNLEECLLVLLEQLGMMDTVAGEIVSGGYLRDVAFVTTNISYTLTDETSCSGDSYGQVRVQNKLGYSNAVSIHWP